MIKHWEENERLKYSFIQGYFIDQDFCDSVVEEFVGTIDDGSTSDLTKQRYGYKSKDFSSLKFKNPLKNSNFYKEFLYYCLYNYKSNYTLEDKQFLNIGLYNPINVQYYTPGDYYSVYHSERSPTFEDCIAFREFVFITYLNDSDDGYTEFPYQNLKVYPRKGLTVLWPATWNFVHIGSPSKKDKYIITGWFLNLPFSKHECGTLEGFIDNKNLDKDNSEKRFNYS